MFFCVGYSHFWSIPLSVELRRLRKLHGLKWLRILMSYHRFPNLRELFRTDLVSKTRKGVVSKDLQDRACNCRNGDCQYDNLCRKGCLVYKVSCTLCRKSYIGSTQNTLKERMRGHFHDVRRLCQNGEGGDSFARHFREHFCGQALPSQQDVRRWCSFEIVWKGDALSALKSAGQLRCVLCQKERLALLKAHWDSPDGLMNAHLGFNGSCRHKARFHRLLLQV